MSSKQPSSRNTKLSRYFDGDTALLLMMDQKVKIPRTFKAGITLRTLMSNKNKCGRKNGNANRLFHNGKSSKQNGFD